MPWISQPASKWTGDLRSNSSLRTASRNSSNARSTSTEFWAAPTANRKQIKLTEGDLLRLYHARHVLQRRWREAVVLVAYMDEKDVSTCRGNGEAGEWLASFDELTQLACISTGKEVPTALAWRQTPYKDIPVRSIRRNALDTVAYWFVLGCRFMALFIIATRRLRVDGDRPGGIAVPFKA
ncbi:hypothetical protein VTO73DRAFT_13823 [Trametes versicolor]